MFKPWYLLPAQLAHDIAPPALRLTARLFGSSPQSVRPVSFRGLHFPNPLGVAGGVDKTGASAESWFRLGAGFVEIGTVTPKPQGPNPGCILKRSLRHRFLWNRMGFPSPGADAVLQRLQTIQKQGPVLINVGKNRDTDNLHAARDYITCMDKLSSVADAFVLNISSPNTQGLRELQSRDYFEDFLAEVTSSNQTHPVLVKISPDMASGELEALVETALNLKLAGFVLTNTTLTRPSADTFPPQGGFSGEMVKTKSLETLKSVLSLLGERKKDQLVISVGGITTAQDVRERLELGADLVQIYSALVFEGPFLFRRLSRQLSGDLQI